MGWHDRQQTVRACERGKVALVVIVDGADIAWSARDEARGIEIGGEASSVGEAERLATVAAGVLSRLVDDLEALGASVAVAL